MSEQTEVNGTNVVMYVDDVRITSQHSLTTTVKGGVKTHKVEGFLTDVDGAIRMSGTGDVVVTMDRMIELFNNMHEASIKYKDIVVHVSDVVCESLDFMFNCEEAAQYVLILREAEHLSKKINK